MTVNSGNWLDGSDPVTVVQEHCLANSNSNVVRFEHMGMDGIEWICEDAASCCSDRFHK